MYTNTNMIMITEMVRLRLCRPSTVTSTNSIRNMNIDVFKNHFENVFEDDFANDFVNIKVSNSSNREYSTKRSRLIENKSVNDKNVFVNHFVNNFVSEPPKPLGDDIDDINEINDINDVTHFVNDKNVFVNIVMLNTNTNTNDFVNDFVVSLPDLTSNMNTTTNDFVVSLPDPTLSMHTNTTMTTNLTMTTTKNMTTSTNTDVFPVKHKTSTNVFVNKRPLGLTEILSKLL